MESNKISVKDLNLYYGEKHVLQDVGLDVGEHSVMALIGPSGCGKSTFLKCINRMNDLAESVKIRGKVLLDGEDIYDRRVDTTLLRKKVGMVFQQPNPFPMSIYDNVAYGPRLHGIKGKGELDEIVERALTDAAVFEEVRDCLKKIGAGAVGRTAAAPLYCQGSGSGTGGAADGRTNGSAGSGIHIKDRRIGSEPAKKIYGYHCDP